MSRGIYLSEDRIVEMDLTEGPEQIDRNINTMSSGPSTSSGRFDPRINIGCEREESNFPGDSSYDG